MRNKPLITTFMEQRVNKINSRLVLQDCANNTVIYAYSFYLHGCDNL